MIDDPKHLSTNDRRLTTCLTIAGSDPSGGAGIQADLRTFEAFGVSGVSAVTAITAQTENRFVSIYPTPADILTQQLSVVSKDIKIDAIKVGMVATAANVQALIWFLKRMRNIPIVVDPVLDSSTGYPLIEPEALHLFEYQLLPLATVVTPNLREAGTLAKMRVSDLETMKTAAKIIYDNIRQMQSDKGRDLSIVLKGGHLKVSSTDLVYCDSSFTEIEGTVFGKNLHGSGCLFSSAITAGLAKGLDIIKATQEAKKYITSLFR